MTETAPVFHLGIIGGCMSHQDGMPLSKLYHRRIAQQLMGETGIKLRVHIARDFRQAYVERLEGLLSKQHLDGVLIHIRIASTAAKSTILSRYRHDSTNTVGYYLHPFLLNRRRTGWADVNASNFQGTRPVVQRKAGVMSDGHEQHIEPRPGKRLLSFRFNDMNVILGHLAGLDNWAVRDEVEMFKELVQVCNAQNIPCIVMGPSPYNGTFWIKRLSGKLTQKLATAADELNVPFCSIDRTVDTEGNPTLLADELHLSEDGQCFVANQLYPVVKPWAAAIVAQQAGGQAMSDRLEQAARPQRQIHFEPDARNVRSM